MSGSYFPPTYFPPRYFAPRYFPGPDQPVVVVDQRPVQPDNAILRVLLADPAVAALIGTRGYSVKWPQSPRSPAILVEVIEGESLCNHLRGSGGFYPCRVRLNVLAAD